MFLVRCPTSIQDPCKHPRTTPAEFLIFSRTKNVFFCGLQIIKIPIAETDFIQKYTNSIRGFEPFGFNDRMHVPNTCQSVFPHDHCSSLFGILLSPFHILLREFKIFGKFGFTRLVIVTLCGITMFCVVLNYFKWGRRSKLGIYASILLAPG